MTLPLFSHQQAAIDLAIKRGHLALFHEQGLGKTRTALEIFKRHRETQPDLKLLVICPISVIEDAWRANATKWVSEFSFLNLRKAKSKDKLADYDIIAVNYEKLISKNGKTQVVDFIKLQNPMVFLDESSKMKGHKSKITKALLSLAHHFKYRLIGSGTPAPNGPWEYWAQINFVKPNTLFGSYYEFQNRFFELRRGKPPKEQVAACGYAPGRMMQEGFRLAISEKKHSLLNDVIGKFVHRMDKQTAELDLPPKIFQTRHVILSREERKAYNEIKNHLITEIGNQVIVTPHLLPKFMKLRQILSGFLYDATGIAHHIGSSKIKELKAVLDNLGKHQIIIWCQFTEEIVMLEYLLSETLGRSCSTLYGGTGDRCNEIEKFKSGKTQYLLAHPAAAAHGITFTNCSRMIYFSNSFSYEHYAQSQDRNHRPGQKADSCLYIHLVAENTIEDQLIYPALRNKGKVSNDDLRKFLRS